MARDRVTIPQLAEELGLGVGTVSGALNGTGRVAAETRTRVLEHARARGYRTNSAAKSLRLGATQAIELHLPENARHLSFYIDFAFGVVDAAADNGFDVLLTTADRPRSGTRSADGAVFIDCQEGSTRLRELRESEVPVVAADGVPRGLPPANLAVDIDYEWVVTQFLRAGQEAGARLALLVAPDASLASAWRDRLLDAFARQTITVGLPGRVRDFAVDGTDAELVELIASELGGEQAPDLLVFGGQRLAAVAASALELGLPGSAAPWLASCAGDPLSEVADPRIAAVDARPRAFGARCGNALATLLGEATPPRNAEERWPVQIAWATHWGPRSE